jgi:adenylate cyclase
MLVGLAGDVPPERLAGYRGFEAALADYRAQRWDAAEAGFRRAKELLGADAASDVFLDRIAVFRLEPPPAEWDATYALATK